MAEKKRILVVAAHPDDEILGCGATIARMIKEGCEAHTLILGEGVTSRDEQRDADSRKAEIEELKGHVHKANKIIGVEDAILKDLPDNRFDSLPLLDIVKIVEEVKKDIRPDIIFTHYQNDLNVDHQITYRAVITATRPMTDETVKEIYSFEVASSTEWNYPLTFSPDVFIDVSETIDLKLKSLEQYITEMKDSDHPRSLKGAEHRAKSWGIKTGLPYVEAFKLVRIIR
ncbi:MAG: PIG-L family deacetylase [Candidatus Omnitrophica bacterium]|nr:PIG-L family deacetylase [Candidatus Omnitrophota bacterium]